MKIVVTGALGHIGSLLVRHLAMEFPLAEINMIDNMMTQRFASLFNLPTTGKLKFIENDITKIDLKPILKNANIVIHLAAITDAEASFSNSELVEENNFQGTEKVALASVEAGAKLISLSSTSVYGTQKNIVAENCRPDELKPQSPYAATKLKEEKLVQSLCDTKGLKAVTCRFGTIYGVSPGMRFHTAVNKFCWQAVMGQPISVWSTAYEQKRPYLDIVDAVRAITFIIDKQIFDGKIYNVLSDNITVKGVVDMIREFIPDLETIFVKNKIMNQLSYEVSRERFEKKGFVFSGNLHQGIGETIALLKQSNFKLNKDK
jgi:UDP-glucose 4-epimerase